MPIEICYYKSMRHKTNVLVTGGGGFIGSHLIAQLLQKRLRVYSYDNYVSTNGALLPERNHKSARYLEGDIRDVPFLSRTIKRIRPKFIFHTAALARIQPSIKNPTEYLEVNSRGTLNILLAARGAGVRRVVYSASSSAYGDNPIPLHENQTPRPLNPYAKTKLDGEQWMKIFAELYGVETVSLRYFNVYGLGNIYNGPYTTVITLFLHHFARGKPMEIIGDGKQTRDYTHVFDVARANILAAMSNKVGRGEVINIGCGDPHSVNEIAERIGGATLEQLRKEKKAIFIPARPGESRHTKANITKAKRLLGWTPRISFADGIAKLKR